MKKIAIVLMILLLTACNSTSLSKELTVVEFNQEVSGPIKLNIFNLYSNNPEISKIEIINAKDVKVIAKVNEELLDYDFDIILQDNSIEISTNSDKPFDNLSVDLQIFGPINSLHIEGGYEMIYERVEFERIDVTIEGAGDFKITEIESKQFDLHLAGAAAFELSGISDSLNIHLEGAGSIKAFDLTALDVDVVLEGAGSVEVFAQNTLNAQINGIGSITYDGSPQLQKEVNGLGTIQAR